MGGRSRPLAALHHLAALAVLVVVVCAPWTPARADEARPDRRNLPPPVIRPVGPRPTAPTPSRVVPAPRAPTPTRVVPTPGRMPPPPPPPTPRVAPPPPVAPRTVTPRSAPLRPAPRAPAPRAPVPPPTPMADPALPGGPADASPPAEAPSAGRGNEPIIRRIEFEGNALFASESLQVLMDLKVGERLDPVDLDGDMEMLFRFFETVRVTQEEVPGGVILHFLVSENPLVVELNIYGTDEFEVSEIQEMMTTRAGYPLFPYALATDAEDIVEAYRMRGFHFAQVPAPAITTLEGGGRRVDFTVVEGPKVEVEDIYFRGNQHVYRKDLLEVMQTDSLGFLSFLSDAVFVMDVLLEDLVALKRRVEAEGFLDAEVVLDQLKFSDDKKRVVITIGIVEHQAYMVGDIDIEIDRLEPGEAGAPLPADAAYFTEANLLTWLGLRTGGRYSGICEEKGRKLILEEYYKRSYIDAVVRQSVRRGRESENIVDLTLAVREGAKSRLRRLDFVGNEYTRDKVLRREARIQPGGYVDRRELDRTLTRLRGLGYFDRVTMQIDQAFGRDGEPIPGYKDVTYEIAEASTGQLNFGIGLSTDGGVGGSVQFTKRNFDIAKWPSSFSELTSRRAFTGAGQKLDVYFALGTIESQFAIGFQEPHLFGTDVALNTRFFRRFENWESYSVDRLGYLVGLSYPLYRDYEDRTVLRAGVTWRQENAKITDVGTWAVPGAYLFRGNNEQRSLEALVSLRTVDDLTDPTWRTSSSIRAELTGTFLGGQVDYHKYTLNHQQDWRLFKDDEARHHRLTFRARVGLAEALDGSPEVPPFERFYMGGGSLRGFGFRGAGPHINGRPTGGEWLVNGTLEYEYPVVKDTLGLVVFTDVGTLGTSLWEDDAFNWRLSVGGGIRLLIPGFGSRPLALDFGLPVLSEDVDEKQLVNFSLGRDF